MTVYLDFGLCGGLCNKLLCLMSACDLAIKHNYVLIEPSFGWKRKILFSEIYDLDHFNQALKCYNSGKDIMISSAQFKQKVQDHSTQTQFKQEPRITRITIDRRAIWQHSENILNHQRKTHQIERNCMQAVVLQALKLNKIYQNHINQYLLNR